MKLASLVVLALGLYVLNQAAQGISITYELTPLGGNHYRYAYTVQNEGSLGGAALQLFDVLFDPALYLESSLNPVSAPAITAAWDEQIFTSAPLMPALYDISATAGGLAAGATLAGFAVEFTWLGSPAGPGAQPFEVYDSTTLALLESGTTVSPSVIPAPGSLELIGAGLLGMLAAARRRRAAPLEKALPRQRQLG